MAGECPENDINFALAYRIPSVLVTISSAMNVRKEFRDAFRQYRRRLGLPLASPSSEIRVGELCIFNVDGSVTSLGNVLDLESEEIAVTRSIDTDVDPIISNGMRCRRLGDEERAKYVWQYSYLTSDMISRITTWMKRLCYLGTP